MKNNLLSLAIFCLFTLQIFAHNAPKNETKNDYKTFLIKTQLSKEELLALLQQGETEKVNLKKNESIKEENEIKSFAKLQEINNTVQNNDTLQQQIETEIKEDALHPLDEFHLRQNASEVKAFVAKPQNRFIDSLYEKKFSKIYGYLTLFLFAFVLFYFKDKIFSQKGGFSKDTYRSLFESDSVREYMLAED